MSAAKIVEVFPCGVFKKDIRKKGLPKRGSTVSEIFDYVQEKYVQVFDKYEQVENIVSEMLIKIISTTESKDGFLSLVKNNKTHCYFPYFNREGKISFKPYFEVPVEEENIFNYSIIYKKNVISNNVDADPRPLKIKNPPFQPQVKTFLGLPLIYKGIILGQIGLLNADKYRTHNVEKILMLKKFLKIFIYLWKNKKLNTFKEIEIKKEVVTLKDSFIAAMSHEIRTPLNGIVGMTRMLRETDGLNDDQKRYLDILSQCSVQLMELVNDILDYSKMSAGGLVLHNYNFNIRKCVDEVCDIVSQRAKEKGLEFRKSIPLNFPENVTGDSRRIKQVLFNLLTNAIKFTEQGFVELSVDSADISEKTSISTANLLCRKSKKLTFSIKDSGIGVKVEDQDRIFEVFNKINKDDQAYASTSPGAGMGLAISKFIVEAMNGHIHVESDKKGSIFSFYIVLEDETDIVNLLDIHKKDFENKVAIVVDDTEDNRIFLVDALFSWGVKAHSFSSARESLNYMQKCPQFDIAIIDLCMPNMSGLELIQTMRERKYFQPVIGLSSIGQDIHGKEWFDYFTTKPVSKSQLFNYILRCFIEKETTAIKRKNSSPRESHSEEMNILIAEDDHFNQILITEMLKKLGYKNLTVVSNGKACVDEIKRARYDICLMDVKMPVMDGLTATRKIKEMKNAPVIIAVSASVLDSDKSRCYSAGADAYIEKPIQKDKLESILKLRNLVNISRD